MIRPRPAFLFFLITALSVFSSESQAASPVVRVLVTDGRTNIHLTVKGAYALKSWPSMAPLKKGEKLVNSALLPTRAGFKLGKEEWAAKGLWLEPAKERDLYLDKSRFRGAVLILKAPNGLMYAVNYVDLEDYLYGVLHHEVAAWWPMEALKAQAVAARTYALYQASVSKTQDHDLKSSTSSQVYGGSTTERYRARSAVDQTAGQVLVYQGALFPAYFHATCGGITAGSQELWKISLPPLAGGVRCGYCRISPHYYWQAKVPLAEIEEKLAKSGFALGRILEISVVSRTPSQRIGSLRLKGTALETVIAAKDLRVWIGGNRIRSTDFTVGVEDDAAVFKGKSWGHGVGLCQWGALGQAILGRKYEAILRFYYPGADIAPLSELKAAAKAKL